MSRREPHGRTVAVGLDLGSTYIKAGRLDERGRLYDVASLATPVLLGTGRIREGDASSYVRAASSLLGSVSAGLPDRTPLGITSQRSSFTVWDVEDGRPRLPLISWQDRRAAGWCARHASAEPEVVRLSGLLLSAHYAGPKLAWLQQDSPELRAGLRSGQLLFGTLETYLIWSWSRPRRHETDLTMAARTAMVDLAGSDWSPELLSRFDVPRRALPGIVASAGRNLRLEPGLTLRATLADQASGALATLREEADDVLVNLGTGGFILRPTRGAARRVPGYLTAPILGADDDRHRYVLEGTINGAGPAMDRFGDGPTALGATDAAPDAFALPDLAGLGSPYWRPELGLTLSTAARKLGLREQRRIVLEGLLFRVRQILEELCDAPPRRVLVSGGLTRDPAVGPGLAALLGRPVELVAEQQSTLLGVTRLAAGLTPWSDSPTTEVDPEPGGAGSYLADKYGPWREWLAARLAEGRLPPTAPIGDNG